MPQLDPTYFASQLFWLAVVFLLLYGVLSALLLPRIGKVLQTRQDRIAGDLEKAEKFRLEAESVLKEAEVGHAETRAKSTQMINEALHKAEEESARKREDLEQVLHKKLLEAEKRIASSRKNITDRLAGEISGMAQLMVKEMAGLEVSAEQAKDAVKQVI